MILGMERVTSWTELVSAGVVAVVALDLVSEARFRAASGPLATAWRLHRVHAVEPTLARSPERPVGGRVKVADPSERGQA